MKKLFFLSLLALSFIATSCNKDNEKTYPVPTESKTDVDTEKGKVIRTQVIKEGKEAARVTYSFDGVQYSGQEWDVIFSTEGGALTAYAIFGAKYMNNAKVSVTLNVNIVNIKYDIPEGPGDDKLQGLTSLDAIKNAVAVLDILGIFSGIKS